METLVDILRNTDIRVIETSLSQSVEFSQRRKTYSFGPYLPISSGNFNVEAMETSNFHSYVTPVSSLSVINSAVAHFAMKCNIVDAKLYFAF